MKYIDINSGTESSDEEEAIVWMNINEISNAVSSWEDGKEPTTYSNAISEESVEAAGITVYESDKMPNLAPFILFDGVYWEQEAAE